MTIAYKQATRVSTWAPEVKAAWYWC